MEEAYLHASTDDTLPANARQIMYAARDHIQDRTGKQLNDSYFTQTLLPNYVAKYEPSWRDNVAYDDRGHFTEPHTGHSIGLGTIAVREYISDMRGPSFVASYGTRVETCGPSARFGSSALR